MDTDLVTPNLNLFGASNEWCNDYESMLSSMTANGAEPIDRVSGDKCGSETLTTQEHRHARLRVCVCIHAQTRTLVCVYSCTSNATT